MNRLPVRKTYKLFIGGAFPRSESGRTYDAEGANVARGSRKDIRDAVRVARQAGAAWSGMTAYNRGQVLYRVAEMMEARQAELASLSGGGDEVERAIDRVVWYAGWADKLAQVLGSSNPAIQAAACRQERVAGGTRSRYCLPVEGQKTERQTRSSSPGNRTRSSLRSPPGSWSRSRTWAPASLMNRS